MININNIKLIKGDCLEQMDKLIEQNIKVDMILTDIPYGTTSCKWDEIIPFNKMWERINLIKKDKHTPILLFGSEPFSSKLRLSNIKNYKYDWKWNKINGGNPINAKYKPMSIFEDIIVFGDGKINYYPIMTYADNKNKRPRNKGNKKKSDLLSVIKSGEFKSSNNYNENLRYPKNEIISNNKVGELNSLNRLHPTQKPTDLLSYLIKTYSNSNNIILDFTMGVASTGISCIETNRNFIGIEKDDKYFDIGVNRINTYLKNNNLEDNWNVEIE